MRGDCPGKREESPLLVEEIIRVEVRNDREYTQKYTCDDVAGVQGQKWQAMGWGLQQEPTVMEASCTRSKSLNFIQGLGFQGRIYL